MIKYLPFAAKWDNILNVYNETVVSLTFIAVYFLNLFAAETSLCDIFGWIIISLILVSLGITWALLFPPAIKELCMMIGGWCRNAPIVDPSLSSKQELNNPNSNKLTLY